MPAIRPAKPGGTATLAEPGPIWKAPKVSPVWPVTWHSQANKRAGVTPPGSGVSTKLAWAWDTGIPGGKSLDQRRAE
ncbi:MAG: hypothetical protein DWH82_12515 [Planctomycetota bacterium]|nr:MAG: hypothetical protein DWH82_12515 [Planctomycetota bacterium]